MNSTKIEWCTRTLNPVVGCTYGCPYCYARRMNSRFHYVPDFSKPQFFPERLKQLSEKKPQVIFMDSMSDVADWDPEWRRAVFEAMSENSKHRYIFLTKRPELCANDFALGPENVMLGISVTMQKDMERQFHWLREGVDFLSMEPLLESIYPVTVNAKWVICGALTGPQAGKHQPKREWIEQIADLCSRAGIPLFMKNSLAKVWGAPLIQEFPWEESNG